MTQAGPGETSSGAPPSRARIWVSRMWRSLISGIWLVYLIQPVVVVAKGHYSVLHTVGALTIVAAFCGIYLGLIAFWDRSPRYARAAFAALFVLAVVASVGYGGTPAWIFVSAAAGLVIPSPRTAMRVVLASAACYTVSCLAAHVDTTDLLLNLIPTVLVGFAMAGFRRQMELTRELRGARETVARLAANEERLRLARDLHDLTGQSLSMITLKSELAARLVRRLPEEADRDRALDEIEQVASVSRQTLHDIREAISGYRRPTLAVEIITARTALETAGIMPHDDPEIILLSGTFNPDVEAALAWCLREAVTNVVRHSRAANCHITLSRRADTLSLEVRDDGCGPSGDDSPKHGGTGLRGMAERLSAVGGRLELRPGPLGSRTGPRAQGSRPSPRGFRLIASIPVRNSATVKV
jgi:two-component system, NarL family, sensor histidine kinase DesK